MLSCYAPTRAASRDIKDEFFADLEQALASIPSDEPYILLGNLNACVGSRSDTDDTWEGVECEGHMGMVRVTMQEGNC